MDDSLPVGVGKRVAERDPDRQDRSIGEAALGKRMLEGRARNELRDQIGRTVVRGGFIEGDDPGMRQSCRCPGLALEPRPDHAGMQYRLDRDLALQALVEG